MLLLSKCKRVQISLFKTVKFVKKYFRRLNSKKWSSIKTERNFNHPGLSTVTILKKKVITVGNPKSVRIPKKLTSKYSKITSLDKSNWFFFRVFCFWKELSGVYIYLTFSNIDQSTLHLISLSLGYVSGLIMSKAYSYLWRGQWTVFLKKLYT